MRAVLYVRVSRSDGVQEPETQLRQLREFARSKQWRVVSELADRVTGDPLRRGRNPPGLSSALELIERRKAEVLAVFAADRLVRSPIHLLQLVAQVQAAGGRVASLQDGADLDTTTDAGELFVFLRGWWAKMELRLTRARTMAGLERARAEGKRFGRPEAPLPELAALESLLKSGVRDRQQLAARLGCGTWAVRKGLAALRRRLAQGAGSPAERDAPASCPTTGGTAWDPP